MLDQERLPREDRHASAAERMRNLAPLFLRLVVGATFIVHGHEKIFERGVMETAQGLQGMGIPLAGMLGPAVPFIELIGGIGLVVGAFTRLWALLLAFVMSFAILFVHLGQGYKMHAVIVEEGGKHIAQSHGWEWQALLLAASVSLVFSGAGYLSLDWLMCDRKHGSRHEVHERKIF